MLLTTILQLSRVGFELCPWTMESNFVAIELILFDKTSMEEILPYQVVSCSQLLKVELEGIGGLVCVVVSEEGHIGTKRCMTVTCRAVVRDVTCSQYSL